MQKLSCTTNSYHLILTSRCLPIFARIEIWRHQHPERYQAVPLATPLPTPSYQRLGHLEDWRARVGFPRIGRGRGGATRGGRGGARPQGSFSQRGGKAQTDAVESTPFPSAAPPSKKEAPVSRKASAPNPSSAQPNGASEKAANGSAERVVAPASPTSELSQSVPSTPSRSAARHRRPQQGKSPISGSKPPLPQPIKVQKSRSGSTPISQVAIRKDLPPHLAAAHEAEIRHDVDALVERVRAVAMAENKNRPTTPGSHIDWAGDEDDSLPDLDDWGVTTTLVNTSNSGDQDQQISPILVDTLKPLPEPQTMPTAPSSSAKEEIVAPSIAVIASEKTIAAVVAEPPPAPVQPDVKPCLSHPLPPKPVSTTESLPARRRSIPKSANLPKKPSPLVAEEGLTKGNEGLSESLHAPSAQELAAMEKESNTSSSERGLDASVHAPKPSLLESHSAPNLLSSQAVSATSRTHSRSQTEGRPASYQPHTAPANVPSHRFSRSGASSPLGQHVHTHVRNHSTPPAGGAGLRPPHASRPVITDEAISRLTRAMGRHGPATRTQAIAVTDGSTIAS
ncbi:hypothetical protein BU15DRAFT_69781 [Melanogaster broomeanus]|nr:hypothetical protein BU15DRAFT_69781 [Melanogaster broomeanus]